jgi:hypothetical protein
LKQCSENGKGKKEKEKEKGKRKAKVGRCHSCG